MVPSGFSLVTSWSMMNWGQRNLQTTGLFWNPSRGTR